MNEEHERLKGKYYVAREFLSTHPAICPCGQCATQYRFEESLVLRGIIPEVDMGYRMLDRAWSAQQEKQDG